jgi:hypothetical protein
MAKRWDLHAHPGFAQSLYRVPLGAAGKLTEAIEALRHNHTPSNSEEIPQRPRRRRLRQVISGREFIVAYEILAEENAIRLLIVEEEALDNQT